MSHESQQSSSSANEGYGVQCEEDDNSMINYVEQNDSNKSPAWKYFKVQQKSGKATGYAKCKLCSKILSCKNTTLGIYRHLKAIHKEATAHTTSLAPTGIHVDKVSKVLTDAKKEKINDCIVEMVTKDMLPYSIVEKEGFKKYSALLNACYEIPSRRTLSRNVMLKYDFAMEKVKALLSHHDGFFVITSDLWSDRRHRTYITVTVHFVDDVFFVQDIVWATKPITGRRTGEVVCTV